MASRKIVFNIYEELPKGEGNKEINGYMVASVAKEIPFNGVIEFKPCSDGKRLVACKRDYVKLETYDIWWDMC